MSSLANITMRKYYLRELFGSVPGNLSGIDSTVLMQSFRDLGEEILGRNVAAGWEVVRVATSEFFALQNNGVEQRDEEVGDYELVSGTKPFNGENNSRSCTLIVLQTLS